MRGNGGKDETVWIGILASDPLRSIGLQSILEDVLRYRTKILSEEARPRDSKPTILIMDEGLGSAHEEQTVSQRAMLRTPGALIVLLTREDTAAVAKRAFAAGARAILPETAEVAQIRACIRAVLRGKTWQPNETRESATETANDPRPPEATLTQRFTPKEREVLRWLAQGHSNREIAATMGIDEATVKAHLGRMLRKADASNRVELTLRALAGEKVRPLKA